jgi:hypothetical protein
VPGRCRTGRSTGWLCTSSWIELQHEDQRVLGVGAAGHLLRDQSHRIVVVGLLGLGRVDAIDRRIEVAHVVVHHAHQLQLRQVVARHELVELARPLLHPVKIRKYVVEAAEVGVGDADQIRVGGHRHRYVSAERVAYRWNAADRAWDALRGTSAPLDVYGVDAANGKPQAKVFTKPNRPVPGAAPGTFVRPAADALEDAIWSARRDTTGTGYGIGVFDLDPGGPGGRTTITVRYYHAPGADKTPTASYELFDTIVLAKRRRD